MSQADVARSLDQYLASRHVPPSTLWLNTFTSTSKLNTPLPALQKSAEYRLLATDISQTLDKARTSALPSSALDATQKEQYIRAPVVLQLLDIEDISRPRWAQIELIEQTERGETTRGREIIRAIRDSEDRGPPAPEESKGPHKLLLQDVNGVKIQAFELRTVQGVGLGMSIGAKIVVTKGTIARGLLLLEPEGTQVLGGKVAAWQEAWTKERKQMLKARLGVAADADATNGTS